MTLALPVAPTANVSEWRIISEDSVFLSSLERFLFLLQEIWKLSSHKIKQLYSYLRVTPDLKDSILIWGMHTLISSKVLQLCHPLLPLFLNVLSLATGLKSTLLTLPLINRYISFILKAYFTNQQNLRVVKIGC